LLSVLALALTIATIERTGGARAGAATHPAEPSPTTARELAAIADHYRGVTWTYQRAARVKLTPSSLSYRRSRDGAYLQWTIELWQARARRARARALAAVRRRTRVELPAVPAERGPIVRRIAFQRSLTWRLQRIYPGRVTAGSAAFRHTRSDAYRRWALRLWQRRAAAAALAVVRHAPRRARAPAALAHAFVCIHRYEAAWTANTGNGYFGGLQMDRPFMRRYGADFLGRWGTADRWPAWAQIEAAVRAYHDGRGFSPWPNTARACGVL
jgi:Transglycosylase-like domain